MAKRAGIEQYKQDVEKNVIFEDTNTGHVFSRGPLLGKGGFGFVYETSMPGYTRRLVLKAIPKGRVVRAHQRQRIQNEIHLHKSLNHENIVKLYHSFEEELVICMIIERCERSLLDLLQEQESHVIPQDVSIVARQALEALAYLHELNIIHRDLKLGNILLKNSLLVKVCDFGLAKYYNASDKPSICGTPNYLGPEVLKLEGHCPLSDVWSLGCVLVVLLTGRPPFEGQSTEETYKLIQHAELKMPSKVPPYVENFIVRMLEKDLRERMTIEQALDHEFIRHFCHLDHQRNEYTLDSNKNIIPQENRNEYYRDTDVQRNNFKSHGKRFTGISKIDTNLLNSSLLRRVLSGKNYEKSKTMAAKTSFINMLEGTDDQLWIQCWIDYTNKDCGFAYRLSNDTVGVKLNRDKISYVLKRTINRSMEEFKYEYYSESRNKTVTFKKLSDVKHKKHSDERFLKHVSEMQSLVDYYDSYMIEHLINAGNIPYTSENENSVCKIRLLDWYKNNHCVAMILSNYTVQVNFFDTHLKILIQGQFNKQKGFSMPIPLTPSTKGNETLGVIPMSSHDVKQRFKIMLVTEKRRCYQLDTGMVLKLLASGPNAFPANITKDLGFSIELLHETMLHTHKVMHNLRTLSSKCYSESLICSAVGNCDMKDEVEMKVDTSPHNSSVFSPSPYDDVNLV